MKLRYTISMESPDTHYLGVTLEIQGYRAATGKKTVRLLMPVWTPGSYKKRDYAQNIDGLEANEVKGRILKVEKYLTNGWEVSLEESDEIQIRYRVYADSYGVTSSYLGSEHAVIAGASVFLFVEGTEKESMVLRVIPYPSWTLVSTSFGGGPGDDRRYAVPNYDALVDSNIEVGNQFWSWFSVGKSRFEVSIFSPLDINRRKLVQDVKKIVESTAPIFGEIPYSRYLFQLDFGEGARRSLGHANSSLCILSYFEMDQPQEYARALSTISHEFVHSWNPKRVRPIDMHSLDHFRENIIRSLWITEGFTSYYGAIIPRRAGLIPVEDCLDGFCSGMNRLELLRLVRVQSPRESSFDAWIEKESSDGSNSPPSYCDQGAAIACILDLQIRNQSPAGSLDDVMKTLFQTYREKEGYTEEEFQMVCDQASNGTAAEIFEKYVRGREAIDFQRYFDYAGLELVPKDVGAKTSAFLGVKVRPSDMIVTERLPASPAEKSGLSVGDEIVAVDDLRVDGDKLRVILASTRPGAKLQLTIARDGLLWETQAVLASRPAIEYRLHKKKEATVEQKEIFQRWMVESWETPLQYRNLPAPAVQGRSEYL